MIQEIETPKDFEGKNLHHLNLAILKMLLLRAYLIKNGYKTSENGGNVQVITCPES